MAPHRCDRPGGSVADQEDVTVAGDYDEDISLSPDERWYVVASGRGSGLFETVSQVRRPNFLGPGLEPLTASMPRKLTRAGSFPLFRPRSSGTRCHGSRAGTPGCKSSLGHFLPARQFPDCLALCDADWLAMVARCSTVLDDAIMLVRETALPIKHSTADQLVDDP